jgi:uncharacterized membrane protein
VKIEKLMPENIAKFEVIGKMLLFWIERDAWNKIKNEKKVAQTKSFWVQLATNFHLLWLQI